MAPKVFPSELDIGGDGEGRVFRADNWDSLFEAVGGLDGHRLINYVRSGLDESGNTGLDVTYNSGTAVIGGRYVEIDSDTITLADDTTNYVYARLTRDVNDNVDGVEFDATETTTPPADSVLIAEVRTASGSVVAAQNRDARIKGARGTFGTYTGDGDEGNRHIQLGFTPLVVIACGQSGTPWGIRGRGMTIGFGATTLPGAAITSNVDQAPLPVEFGFLVSGGGTHDLNVSAAVFDFVAFG